MISSVMADRDGARLAVRRISAGSEAPAEAPPIVLLHATLSTSRQLLALGGVLAAAGPVLLVDRRGSGGSKVAEPAPLDIGVHVDDLEAILDEESIATASLVGHSFGGVVALEAAARRPGRVAAVVAWEPPYAAVASESLQRSLASLAEATIRAGRERGPAGAAATFMAGVAGTAWPHLPVRIRSFLEAEGGGAIADARLDGLQPDGLGRIRAPVTILTGGDSEPFYAEIADALALRLPRAHLVCLPGLRHPAPITDPAVVGAAILDALRRPPVGDRDGGRRPASRRGSPT